jgi:hypothetical protein
MALFAAIGISNLPAQSAPLPTPPGHKAVDEMKKFDHNAVPTQSTEARYSAGIFGSYVDDFIDVNYYDSQVKNFLFLGGFPAADGQNVDQTDILTSAPDYQLSVGLAHSFKSFYLGFYFGGQLIDAEGWSDPQGAYQPPADGNKQTGSSASSVFRTAVLLGTPALGGIRLDVNDRSLGLKWGTTVKEKIHPHVDLGITFPNYAETELAPGQTEKEWFGGDWLVGGGLYYDLNDISTLDAAFYLGGAFGPHGKTTTESPGSSTTIKHSTNGDFGALLSAGLKNIYTPVDGISLGIKPTLDIALWGLNADEKTGDTTTDVPSETYFELDLGIAAGISARLPKKLNKFTIISGVALNVLDWYTGYLTGGDPKAKPYSSWRADGISWDTATVGRNSLGLGLVFAPTGNLSIGFGLNTILDNVIRINLVEMTVSPGMFFTGRQPGIGGGTDGPFGGLFTGTRLDLTVSYKQ